MVDVKRVICMQAFALMCDCIFAIGCDAGSSHSSETPDGPITVGKTVIFDIFMRGLGGYHCDITRTWPLGHAPANVEQAHALVRLAHALAKARFNTDEHTYAFNEAVGDLFDSNDYPTIRQDYAPRLRAWLQPCRARSAGHQPERPDEKFQVGSVFCSEYDPDDPRGGWGVRIEDNYYCNPDGHFERLTNFDHNLVVLLS